jgi:CubicO group peptidase (beta-lactamase class C family)
VQSKKFVPKSRWLVFLNIGEVWIVLFTGGEHEMTKICNSLLFLLFVLPWVVGAQGIKQTNPQKVGMSPSLLTKAQERLETSVSSHTLGSAVGLIARSGRIVLLKSVGEAGPGIPITEDAIVRLSSITKPITAVAVLMLSERGALQLTDPVGKYIPEFRALKVAVPTDDAKGMRLVDPDRPITIYDLLTHQAGLEAGYEKLDKFYSESKTAREFASRLAGLPLKFQPGAQFEYGPSYDVLGAIIEIITGRSYDKFLRGELFLPLKMNDTYFFVPEEKRPRLAAQYRRNSAGELVISKNRGQEEPPTDFYAGGGGLRSTVRDYYRFAQFLLNEGELDGVRLLSRKTVRSMTTNHVGIKYSREGYGWGFGMRVRTGLVGTGFGSIGSFGWEGGTGTLFLIDRRERLIIIIFAPTAPRTPGVNELRQGFVTDAYQSIVKPYGR